MQNLYLQIGKISASPVTALIQGPTGSGKELVARAIFHHSKRSKNPFITINCAAIPETLLESELFGHEKGSFTGAERQRIGRFEQANTGTIFLDEIGEMTLGTQAKLLRVLQEKEIQRVGGKDLISIDVRVIAATHHDLAKAVKEKKFREDLFYRLAVITLEVPGLKERTEDIPDLIRYFIARHGPELGFPRSVISKEVVEALSQRHWPGNIRQLENAVSELILLARGHLITQHHLGQTGLENGYASQSAGEENGDSLKALVEDIIRQVQAEKIPSAWPALLGLVEKELYTQMSRTTRGNRSQMAKLLGVSRPTVQEKLEHYVIS
jgi:DNA-binding NtrC family response regulator